MAIKYTIGDNWSSGFIGNMVVPADSQALHGWTLEFDAGFTITNIWGAEIVSHVGNHYVIRNVSWNADVAAGGQASFGFQATTGQATTGMGGTAATGFALNGTPDTTPAPPPPVVPSITINDASITEGDSGTSQMTFTVKLSQAASGPVTVNYTTANGSATAGSDYTAASGTLTFAAGETSKTIAVAIAGDTVVEPNETFTVNLSAASGATIAHASATGTIVDNDVAPPPPPPSGGASLAYSVASNWGSGFTGAMDVGGGGSALHGWTVEFDASFTITSIWNATIVSHVGSHYVVKNADWNGDIAGGKTTSFGFQATPGSSGMAASGFTVNGSTVGTPPPVLPSLSVADASVAEGDSGTHDLAFTVSLSAAATAPVTVAYATSSGGGNGTATAGSDYTATSGTLTFAAGETSKVVHVQVIGDTVVEANETLSLTLSTPSGATIGHGTATGTIINDDTAPLPTLSISDASFAEGSAASPGQGTFTVTLSAASSSAATVNFATVDGTALAGSDYIARSGSLTFAPGETSKTIQVTAIGDSVVEPNESFSVQLSSPTGATLAHSSGAGTIVNDDAAPLPTISISDTSVVEGNPGGGTASGWFSTSGNQIVDSAGHPVQIAGVNWFGFETGLMVPHGLYARSYESMMDQMKDLGFNTIRLPFSSDMLHSTATSFNIDYGKNPDLQGLTALQIMDKIVDYADQIGLKIILDHHRSTAGDGPSSNGLWYDAQHSQAQWVSDWQMLAQRYANHQSVIGADLHNEPYNGTWGGGGATDWAAAAETAGNAIGTVNPNLLIFVEGVANYQGQSYWWGGNLMGVKDRPIDLNLDNKLVYSAHDYPDSVYAQPWFQGGDFPANLSAKFDQMWGYIYKQGIAPVYIGEFGTNLTDPKDAPWFKAITQYMAGDLNNDGTTDIPAGSKGVSWTFWSWNPDSGDTGGILANDWQTVNQSKMAYLKPIEFDLGSGASGGGGTTVPHATFLVTLSTPATQAVTVDWQTVPGTADNTDFVAASGTVTFAPGEQSKTISIAISPDTLVENNETFTVVLSNPHGATVADGTGVGTIVNDDTPAPVVPTLAINDASITEGDSGTSQMTFTVKLSQAASGPVTVNYATANGTAIAGSDYTAASGTLTFAAGETSKTIAVAIAGDTVVEPNETFTVNLSAPSGATIAHASATGTIVDNDVAPPPPPAGSVEAHLALTDSWNSGFDANVTVHNDGSSTNGWQIVVDMPNQITDIWNAKIISHDANGYVIGPAAWNGTLAHDSETSFGFVASGAYNASSVSVHGVDDTPTSVPTVPTDLAASATSSSSTLLSWHGSSVPGGGAVTGYSIFEDGHQIATTTGTSYRVGGLTPDTDYHFTVTATDAVGSSVQTGAVAVHTTVPLRSTDDGHMFSPYIDMAMSQDADLTAVSHASGIQNFTLAFMLASNQGIGWQGQGTITDDTLSNGTTMLQQVQAVQAAGGHITISFGGAAGTEAALAATSANQLQAQYQSVIDRYHVDSIDFDIEGAAVADQHSLSLRDQALVGLQAANPGLKVSFTLPVLPTGLTADGLHVLQQAQVDGVRIDRVNIMTMDYGQSVDNNGQMGVSAIQATQATEQQLASIGLNAKIGITPMIGVNDIASEVFTKADAQALVNFAKTDPHVDMLAMWSVARDNGNSAGAHYASSDSSGIAQQPFEFSSIFHQYDVL